MSETNGTNGHTITAVTAVELDAQVARYRTAIVNLLARLKRHSREYASWEDQQLIRTVEAMLDEDAPKPPPKATGETA